MGVIIGGILTGILVTFIINFSFGSINRGLAILAELAGAGVLVYFGFLQSLRRQPGGLLPQTPPPL